MPYILAEPYVFCEYNPSKTNPEWTYVCKAKFFNKMGQNFIWYHDPPAAVPFMVKMKQVLHDNFIFNAITSIDLLPILFGGYKDISPRVLIQSHHDIMLQEISRCEILEYTEDTYSMDLMFE